MKADFKKDFNPFCDSRFRVSIDNEDMLKNRMLIELCTDELLQLRNKIDVI